METFAKKNAVVRILAADDSAVMRHMLATLFESAAEHAGEDELRIELCGAVSDGLLCLEAARALKPDMLLLDLEMPRMGGMEVLDTLHREMPHMPIIMCSASTARGAATTIDALARGAEDYVTKSSGSKNAMSAMASLSAQLLPKLTALAEKLRRKPAPQLQPTHMRSSIQVTAEVIGIGVSTGGPAVLEKLLPRLPLDLRAPVLIVQHMPKIFTQALAQRLDGVCGLSVREAFDGAIVRAGTVWLAPGDRHMEIRREGTVASIALHNGPDLNHCRPAVDYLFRSLAREYRSRVLGVVLTGMGSDGLAGARELVAAGGTVIVQDEASSAVWGMPGRVAEAGLASAVLSIEGLRQQIVASGAAAPLSERTYAAKEIARYAM